MSDETTSPVMRHVIENELTELMSAGWELAQDLEASLEERYLARDTQPVQQRRFDRDMEPVKRFREAYERLKF